MKHPLACTLPRRRVNAHSRAARATPSSRALCPFPRGCSGLPSLDCQCHLVSPHSSCCINFFLFPPFLFCFQLSNGFSHCSLSSEPRAGPVGANLFPHCLPASRLLPRVTSVHLPDYAHYYTIGPGMFPSSHIPSWKVCVSPPSSLLSPVSASVLTRSSPWSPLAPFLSHSSFFPVTPLPK